VRDVNEVDDVSAEEAIQIVSYRARCNEEQGGAPQSAATPPEQENTEKAHHRDCPRDAQERHPHALRHGPKKVESDVGVLGIPEVQEAANQLPRAVAFELALRDALCNVVTSDKKDEPDEKGEALQSDALEKALDKPLEDGWHGGHNRVRPPPIPVQRASLGWQRVEQRP
jgi:hypothetical protein